MGTVNPVGNNVDETWAALCAGKSGIGPITKFDPVRHATKIAGELKNFNPLALRGQEGTAKARRVHRLRPGLRGDGHEGLGARHRRGKRRARGHDHRLGHRRGSRPSRRNTPSSSRAAPGEFPLSPSRPSCPTSPRDRSPSDTGPKAPSAAPSRPAPPARAPSAWHSA